MSEPLTEAIQTYVRTCVTQAVMMVAHEIASRHSEFVVTVPDGRFSSSVSVIEPLKLAEVISDAAQKFLSQRG